MKTISFEDAQWRWDNMSPPDDDGTQYWDRVTEMVNGDLAEADPTAVIEEVSDLLQDEDYMRALLAVCSQRKLTDAQDRAWSSFANTLRVRLKCVAERAVEDEVEWKRAESESAEYEQRM